MHACILDCGVVYEHVQSSILLCFKVTNITYKDTPLENTRIHVQNVRRRYVRIDIGVGTRGGGGLFMEGLRLILVPTNTHDHLKIYM